MPEVFPFKTKRQEVLGAYDKHAKKNNSAYEVNTKPYHSTRALEIEVVDHEETDQFAYGVVRRQNLEFFGYGVGERITIGDVTRQATDADTNLAKAKSTNGAADFVVEGVGFGSKGFRIRDASADLMVHGEAFDGRAGKDPSVVAAIAGQRPVVDPGAIMCPPQVYSPFNLENAILQGLLGHMSVTLEWDRRRVEKLGAADLFPQGGAASYLRASGEPRSDNRWRIPEGYIWRREGQPDSELLVQLRVEEEVVIPLNLLDDPDTGNTVAPDRIWMDVVCRIFGLEVELPSGN